MEFYKETDFQNTEIYKIPKGWDVKKIGEIGKVITGTTPRTKVDKYWNGNYPFVTPTDISEAKYVDRTERTVSEEGARVGRLIPRDSVLVTCIASIGKSALAFEECITNQQINAIICNKEIDPHYTYYILKYRDNALKNAAGKTTNAIIKKSLFEQFKIPIPHTIEEQRQIATILSRVDGSIQKTDEIIQKNQLLKKSLMQELLTKGIGHKEFKFSYELNCEIPKEWRIVNLHNVVDSENDIVAGPFGSNLKVADYRQEGVPIIRLQNIERNEFINKDIKYTSQKKAEELNYHSYKPGDIVLAKLGDPLGKTCIVPDYIEKGIVVADVVRIRISSKKAVNKYIEYILNFSICSNQLYKETIGSTRPRVNISQVRNLKIPLPSLREQHKIASILSKVDDQIEKERQTKEELEKLKKGLMQILLTGKVRVKVN